jgi:ACS family glucarate transporter-like MFS transporter
VSPGRWALVGLLAATATASYLCRVNVSVTGVLMMEEFHLSQPEMGWIFSAFLFGYALCQIPGGMLADRFGAPRVLAWSSLWWLFASLALAGTGLLFGGTGLGLLAALLTVRFVLGVGEAPTFPAAAQGVSRWIAPSQQGRANGLVLAAIGLGSAIAPPFLSGVMVRWGWRAAVAVSALPALAVSLAWFRLRDADAAVHHFAEASEIRGAGVSPSATDVGKLPRSLSFALLTLSYTLQGYVGYIFVFWFYLYLVQERHFDLLQGAWVSSLPWVLSLASIPLGGWISDRLVSGRMGLRWGRRTVPLVGLTVAGLLLALGAHTRSAYFAAGYLALSTALVLSVEGPFWATMMEIAGSRSGSAGGIMNMGSNLGGLISPALTPLLAAWIGWENALHIAAILSVVAGLLWFGVAPASTRRQEEGNHR